MILAAGRGERMRPLTDVTPKPLLAVGGKPLIVRIIEALRCAEVRDVVINVSHLGDQIEAALRDGHELGVGIRYSREPEALETAGGIAAALPLLGTDPFLVINGDLYTEYAFAGLAARAAAWKERADATLAHLVLIDNPAHHPRGDFGLADDRVLADAPQRYTFSGIGLYRPALFSGIAAGEKRPLAQLLRAAMARGAVTGEHFCGVWQDIGTPERLHALDAALRDRDI